MKFVQSKEFNNAVYLTVETNEGNAPFIITDVFFFNNVEKTDYTITCRINRPVSETLYQAVQQLESELVLALKEMNDAMYVTLPFECQKQLAEYPREMYPHLLRSNYLNQTGYPTMFLKGNFKNMKIFSMNDNRVLQPQELTTGNYRFMIRSNLVYFGKHTKPNQIANLQLRISEIYFQPVMPEVTQPMMPEVIQPMMSTQPLSFNPESDPVEVPKPTRKRKSKKKEEENSTKMQSTEAF